MRRSTKCVQASASPRKRMGDCLVEMEEAVAVGMVIRWML